MPHLYNYSNQPDPFLWKQRGPNELVSQHDLNLSNWGPFNKRYFGLSHLQELTGARIDWFVVPELHRRSFAIPHALRESGYCPWTATPDFSQYSYRQQVLAKDVLYCDIHFEAIDAESYRVTAKWTNQSECSRETRLHLCGGWQSMAEGSWNPRAYTTQHPDLPEGVEWIDALNYLSADLIAKPSVYGLNVDGKRQAEVMGHDLVGAQGIDWPKSDPSSHAPTASYRCPQNGHHQAVQIRYQLANSPANARLHFFNQDRPISSQLLELKSSDSLSKAVPIPTAASHFQLEIEHESNCILDGCLLGTAESLSEVVFKSAPTQCKPIVTHLSTGRYQIDWPELALAYELRTESDGWIRYYQGDVESALLLSQHNHVHETICAPGTGEHFDFIDTPKTIASGEFLQQSFTIRLLSPPSRQRDRGLMEPKGLPIQPLKNHVDPSFGIERLAAVTLTNVVYPVRVQGQCIRHYTPGRWWDSLYTWDCGCIGIGLSELSPARSVELLNTYLTNPGDPECAFIHHGSPVPTQFYQWLELWQKTQDRHILEAFYPRLEQYLDYLSGNHPGSPTKPFQSELRHSWDLFYNSGGWDDYPPQVHVGAQTELRARTATMVFNTHLILAAQIMSKAARALGQSTEKWDTLVENIRQAIEAHAWDAKAETYSYVVHDESGRPSEHLLHSESEQNYNLGLDGLMPLIAGGLQSERAEVLWRKLKSSEHFFTQIGLSNVDTQAAYYSTAGYWNGAVWMPYQYFFWKAALDYGDADFAYDLAMRILKHYSQETEDAYACFEHFMIDSERGSGWHHFSGLSAPIIAIYAAYYQPGRVSTGLQTWIQAQTWSEDLNRCRIEITVSPVQAKQSAAILVTMPPHPNRTVRLNDEIIPHTCPHAGLYTLEIPSKDSIQVIEIC